MLHGYALFFLFWLERSLEADEVSGYSLPMFLPMGCRSLGYSGAEVYGIRVPKFGSLRCRSLGHFASPPVSGLDSNEARRKAMRDQGIPTSQQPVSQSSNKSGKEYRYENRVKFRKDFATYLLELKKLTGTNIDSAMLCSLDEVERIRKNTDIATNSNNFIINFGDKNSDRFEKFIKNLGKANSHPVYVWTQSANLFGLYKADSISAIDFAFSFDINTSGIVTFLTEDLNDELLLDFYYDSQNQEMLEVELKGRNWSSITF
jgi:hypothetical protein